MWSILGWSDGIYRDRWLDAQLIMDPWSKSVDETMHIREYIVYRDDTGPLAPTT